MNVTPPARAPRLGFLPVLALLLVAQLGPAGVIDTAQAQVPPPPVRYVILVSFDGLRADALRSVWPAALRQQGAASWTAQTVLPSVTIPAHVSMITGVDPEVHGIRFNEWTPDLGRLTLPSIFTRVRGAGGGVVVLVAKPKLRFLVPEEMPAEWLPYPRYRQAAVLAAAAERFRDIRPALLFAHVADPDDAGHLSGWMSPRYLSVVQEIPGVLERLLDQVRGAGAWEETLVIVTADHGGHGRLHGTSRPDDVTIPWVALGGAARGGVMLEDSIRVYDTAPTVLWALGIPIPGGWQGRPVRAALEAAVPVRR